MSDFYKDKTVLITGGNGFLGKRLGFLLRSLGANTLLPTSSQVDLTNLTHTWFKYEAANRIAPGDIDIVFHLAALVGGIDYNRRFPLLLLAENSRMAFSVADIALEHGAKLVAAGSVCAYPFEVSVPTKEEELYSGIPEWSNRAYGMSKRILLETQVALNREYEIPCAHLVCANLYGPGDHFGSSSGHVIPMLIEKIQRSIDEPGKPVIVWGDGTPTRDFLFVRDAATAYALAGEFIGNPEPINIANGVETRISELVELLCDIMGYDGEVVYDTSAPNGQIRRLFDVSRAMKLLNWHARYSLRDGLMETVSDYRERGRGK